jgi:transcriptional regulator with XRE-family HTH domain
MVVTRLREERGWSIARLADRSGINPTHLGVLERGGNIPSLITIFQLGDALGIDGADIVRVVEQLRREAHRRQLAGKQAAAKERAEQRTLAASEPDAENEPGQS